MNPLINKLSKYDFFNNLLPGVIFMIFVERFIMVPVGPSNIVEKFFFYFFIGLIISRIGSLIIEPTFKAFKFISYRKHELFIEASKSDDKIDTLVVMNNLYRSLVSLFIILLFMIATRALLYKSNEYCAHLLVLVALVLLFSFSYRKQTSLIVSRIDRAVSTKREDK